MDLAAVSPANLTSFSRFTSLPSELRVMIWRNALPDSETLGVRPALYPYRPNVWRTYRVPPEDSDPGQWPWRMRFCRERLDKVWFPLPPLGRVCREARDIVLSWAAANGIHWVDGRLARAFDPEYDVLYVTEDQLDDFYYSGTMYEESDYPDTGADLGLSRLALSWRVVAQEDYREWWVETGLGPSEHGVIAMDLRHAFHSLGTLFLVVDVPPEFGTCHGQVHERWEISPTPTRELRWTNGWGPPLSPLEEDEINWTGEDWDGGDNPIEQAVSLDVGLAGRVKNGWTLSQRGRENRHGGENSFIVRPAFVVKR